MKAGHYDVLLTQRVLHLWCLHFFKLADGDDTEHRFLWIHDMDGLAIYVLLLDRLQ